MRVAVGCWEGRECGLGPVSWVVCHLSSDGQGTLGCCRQKWGSEGWWRKKAGEGDELARDIED